MSGVRSRLFGPAVVEVNGRPVKLTPTTIAVFIRLIIADGAPVTVDEIFRDIWPGSGTVDRDGRIKVQRRILEIREALDPDHPGEKSRAVLTERGRITAYKLVINRESVDVFQFIDLVTRARRASLDDKIALLRQALDLWKGTPLSDVSDQPWAEQTVRQLRELRLTAKRELMDVYELVGRGYDALSTGEELSWEMPNDDGLAAALARLRDQIRVSQRTGVFREDFTDPDISVLVTSGDLFAQDDANLVVGFCDTFDTDTDRNIIISGESTQGLLLNRLYGGDRRQLDRDLKAALARVPRASVESKSAKPAGKRIRYPLGTVATLHHARRRIFGVAYSRMGNDLIAQSSLPVLRASLENLWEAVYLHGQLKPVAMTLIGSGLSRVREGTYNDLLAVIVRSFVASSRDRYMCPELRVIIHQPAFEKVRVADVLRSAREDTSRLPEAGDRATDPAVGDSGRRRAS